MAQQTLVLCTPDAVSRGVTFEISSQFEKRGLTMVACRMLRATTAQAQAHVDCTKAGSVAQLTSGPAVATVWQGAGAIAAGIEIAGAAGGSDLLSVSPSAASATLEIAVWFGADEVPPPDSNGAAAAASGSVAASAPSADGDAAAAGGKSKGQLKKEAAKAAKAAKKAEAKGGTPAGPAISTEPPSGTRDFFPAEMRTRNWLFAKFRETARQLAFVEYDAPVLEAEQLYVRKGGEEITQQMYNFTDKDGKAVSLRPEMTPTLARMILSLGGKVLLPVKWFSIPQCWRFETVQRGRKREHFQWNMDIVGEASIAAEAELLAGVTSFFKSVGVTSADVGIKVNSRKVLAAILKMYGIDDDKFEAVCVIVDKLDKIGPDETVQLLRDAQVSDEAARKIVASLSLRSIGELQALVGEHPPSPSLG